MDTPRLLDAIREFMRTQQPDALPPLLFGWLRRHGPWERGVLHWNEEGRLSQRAGFDGAHDWLAGAGDPPTNTAAAARLQRDFGAAANRWHDDAGHAVALPLLLAPGDAPRGWLWLQADGPPANAPLDELAELLPHFTAAYDNAEARRNLEFLISARTTELTSLRTQVDRIGRARADFLAGVSHEIRTPMNAILGMSHLALRSGLNPQQHNYVQKVERSAESLLALMNDLIDYSHIEAGQLEIQVAPFDLGGTLETLATLLASAADEKGLELVFNAPADLPLKLVGDAQRLGQVLHGLCTNAIKFTDRGELTVIVEQEQRAGDQVRLRFQVRDTGIGMTPDEQRRLFQPFSQRDAGTARRFGGLGLGLSIAQHLVTLMGGQIGVESQAGHGSNFHFSLPFGLQPSECQDAAPALRGARVLVVDDNASARNVLQRMTQALGLHAESARDGWDALRAVSLAHEAALPFDLLLLDWKMPGMDGVDCARQLLASASRSAPKIAMMTAFGRDDLITRLEVQQVRVDAVLTKPLTPSSLQVAFATLLGHPALQDDPQRSGLFNRHRRQLRGARMLVVDDNAINLELAQELLVSAGMRVTVATDGQQALALLDEQAFDGVLMDVQMPVLDGYAAARAIRAQPRFAALPLIAVTANAMQGDRERALAAGMNDHVAKPLVVELLFDAIARWVRQPAAAAPRAENAAPHAPDRLAQLPGIDARVGRTSTMGNDVLYHRLLLMFLKGQRDFGAMFRAARRSGDGPAALRMAHNLRTVAGSLGAQAVQASGRQLEESCNRGACEAETARLLAAVEADLAPVMAGLAALEAEAAAPPAPYV